MGISKVVADTFRDTSAGAIEGAVGLVDLASQGGAYLYNKATGRNIEPLQYGPMVSDALNLNPDRDSAAYIGGSLVGGALTGGAGAIRSGLQAGAKEGAKAAGTSLAAEAAGYAGSVGAARAAEAAGYGETGQMVAGLAGGMAAGARTPGASAPVKNEAIETMSLSPKLRQYLDTYLRDPNALSQRERNQVEKYLAQAQSDRGAFGRRERMRMELPSQVQRDPVPVNTIKPEDLQGSVLVPVMGDRSIAGGSVSAVEGVPLDQPVLLEGGPLYPAVNSGRGVAWASMKDAAQAKQKHITSAAEKGDPVAVYSAMTDVAMDFNTMTSEILLRQIPALKIPKKARKAFDERIREKFPEWAGVDSPKAIGQVRGEVSSGERPASKLRQEIAFQLSKKEWQNQGFPVYEDTIREITEPALRNVRHGDSGFSVFAGRPGASLLDDARHATYSHGIPGDYLGGFARSVPPEIMFPKIFAKTEGAMTKPKNGAPRPMNRQERVGALQMGHDFELADQQWVDTVSEYLEGRPRPTLLLDAVNN